MSFNVSNRVLSKLANIIKADPGQRGIAPLFVAGDFEASVRALWNAQNVVITTGFPCHPTREVHSETDGPPGAVALSQALTTLGKNVLFVVDDNNWRVMEECIKYCGSRASLHKFKELKSEEFLDKYKIDHMVAIERVGRASDGRYYNMRGLDRSNLVEPIDDMFLEANARGILTTGIGDGGNELGMGKVYDKVVLNIKHGDVIACATSCTFLITAGVSNWGGYALAAGLLSQLGTEHVELVLNNELQTRILQVVEDSGARDGIVPDKLMHVDGLPFDPDHLNIIHLLRQAVINLEGDDFKSETDTN
eukprot:NODE_5479_length_1009_cov_44.620767_g4908_i0.p1 GENE.NODE_5479_length_1009_cov_44.620767_g4908_i0~~NODE_5479_length_1009_cov_44.620767_g4908_i0.p1  ORF type:complete len:325 (+),score=65.73 NODE_5479_length_1009_cov_44.620767_g4908_i0:57-977(+)